MKASYEPLRASPRRLERPFPWGFLGILSAALALLLPICSGQCQDPPKFHSMKPKGTPAPPYNIGVEIDYECLPGYVPKDPPLPTNVVCQKNSTWTHIMEACTTSQCQDPPKFHSMKPKGTPAPPYNIGVEIDYECLPGYVPKDPPLPTNVVCQKNSTWTHIMEACTTSQCQDPPKFHSMKPKGTPAPPYNIGVEIDYECLPGYVPKDPPLPTNVVCQKNSTWTHIMEACTTNVCEDPPKFHSMLPKGNITPPYNIGVEIDYECLPGYVPKDPPLPTRIVCDKNAAWTKIMEACTNECEDPPKFHSMVPKRNATPPYNIGVEIDHECLPGYVPKDPPLPTNIVCQKNATWTKIMEACTHECEDPPKFHSMVPKGNITPPYNIGVEIDYECIPGYVPKDPLLPIRIVCGKNATWTKIMEACKHGYCGDPPKFRTMVSKTNHSPPYNIGVEIDYQCILGYVPRYPPRPTKIVCENTATWTNITEACTNVCDDPPNFHFMRPKGNVTPPYNFGVEIDYECRPGHEPKDVHLPTRIVCQRNATWTEIMEACKKKTCQKLGILVNGQIIFSDGTNEYGTRAQYVCFDGFYLLGPKVLCCLLYGDDVQWSDQPPRCLKITCKPPKKIENGKYTKSDKDSFEYKEEVTYTCDTTNNTDEFSLVGEPKLVCTGHNKWSSDPPECKVVKCNPPEVQNGVLVSGAGKKTYKYKDEVKIECNKGFNLEGNSTVFCEANSTWEPALPKCVEEVTTTTPAPTTVTTPGNTTTTTTTTTTIVTTQVQTTRSQVTQACPVSKEKVQSKGSEAGVGLLMFLIILIVILSIALGGVSVYAALQSTKKA